MYPPARPLASTDRAVVEQHGSEVLSPPAMQVPGGGGGGGGGAGDMRGRHRIQAELKKLEQEARFLEVRLCQLPSFFCYIFSLKITFRTIFQ